MTNSSRSQAARNGAKTRKFRKLHAVETALVVKVDATKVEPQNSIVMGYNGPEGKYKKTKFSTAFDMFGRGLIVSYTKPDGTQGAYKVDVVKLIEALFDADAGSTHQES